MARTGLYKSDVKKARDSLLALGTNPSVDAVRVALGNTGSKTTIHKYLKELDEENGGAGGRTASISEALQDLVARLAGQLQEEANARIDAVQAQSRDKARQHTEALAALQQEIAALSEQLQRAETAAQQEAAAHGRTHEAMHSETIARHTAEQQVADLRGRLAENATHRQSLEEKHQHAREALEHYRQSVKEQRDQDQRRHEQQIQQLQAEMRQLQQSVVLKQEEVTRLNQDGARLVADLSNAKQSLYEAQSRSRELAQKLDELQSVQRRCVLLEALVEEKVTHLSERDSQIVDVTTQNAALTEQIYSLQRDLAAALGKYEVQQTMNEQLRTYLERQDSPASVRPSR
jgi:chromosome segregation ATPase